MLLLHTYIFIFIAVLTNKINMEARMVALDDGGTIQYANISRQCIKLTKLVCLTPYRHVFISRNDWGI